MNNLLVISELCDYKNAQKRHFSLTKGYYISLGLSKLINTYYITTGESYQEDKLNVININEIDQLFIQDIKYILLIREANIIDIIESNSVLKKILLEDKEDRIIGIKSDALVWLSSKAYHNRFKSEYNINFLDFVKKTFDIICVQTKEAKQSGVKLINHRYKQTKEWLEQKIVISPMGVPNSDPYIIKTENPYTINHEYCVDECRKLANDKALHPVCYMERYKAFNKNRKNYNTKKTILIYMGRIKTNKGKTALIMKEIMKKLGETFELHIFPGSFDIFGSGISKFSSKYPHNLQLLRDSIFYDCKNVIIHFPLNDETKHKFLQHAEIGIDFSSTRPRNVKTNVGNAKLLEYCYYGLKVVTEENVCTNHLVKDANNGILIKNIGTVDEYVEAIKLLDTTKYDKQLAINETIKSSNWDLIAKNLLNEFKK